MTGRGEGHCAIVLPESGQAPYGYAGLQGRPVGMSVPAARPALGARFPRWSFPVSWPWPAFRRPRGRGAGRRRGRRFFRW